MLTYSAIWTVRGPSKIGMTYKNSVVDLFSGCGGLSWGFQQSGFETVAAIDGWTPAVATYNLNFDHSASEEPINEQSCLPNAEVIIGGPPCQGFSSAGLRKSGDKRNTNVSIFSRLVARYKPKAFVFENVEGFLTGEKGRFLFDLITPLIEAGYCIHLRKINAANFGIPQHRKRVIAIGGLFWEPTFPDHTHSTFGAPGAKLANGYHLPFTPSLGEVLEGLPRAVPYKKGVVTEPTDHTYSPFNEADTERASHLKAGQRMRDLPEEFWHESYKRRAYRRVMDGTPTERRGGAPAGLRRLSADEPSKAITGGASREFVHPSEDRPLTIRECARIQTFSDHFEFSGTQSEKIQMIGNAVPPHLAEIIAANLAKDLERNVKRANDGRLLSFVPTLSSGMSPILQQVCAEIRERFNGVREPEQQSLCL